MPKFLVPIFILLLAAGVTAQQDNTPVEPMDKTPVISGESTLANH